MDFTKMTCEGFVNVLATKEPVPGGGGAAALAGAIGSALGSMVGSLTVGKKKYADVEQDIKKLMEKAAVIQSELLALVQKDAEAFAPLAMAYGMPKNTEKEIAEKELVMAQALKDACAVPLDIMRKCCEAIDVTGEFALKGSRLAISDAGCSAAILGSALKAASLNVFINTKSMEDREYAEKINTEAQAMLTKYAEKAERIFIDVKERLLIKE